MHFDRSIQEVDSVVAAAVEANESFAALHQVGIFRGRHAQGALASLDADRVHQVITNLISNAAKFSPDGSEIRIDVDAELAHIKVSVTDSGPGIAEEFQTRIFQRFAQAEAADSRKYAGTGLGLHISKMIVDLHGGEIGFDTEKGRGTTFWFRLPAAVPAPARAGRVLVLEASPEISARIRAVLEGEGASVSVVASLAEAGALASGHLFDAVAVGSVPDADDAIDAVRHLHEYAGLKEAPVVVVSPGAAEDVEGVVRGLATWLRKPREFEYTPMSVRALPERPVVLHVEDDRDLGRVVAAVIGPNFDTRTVHTVREAKAMIEAESVDLMILDVDLADGNGLSLVAELHDQQPGVPVVVFSGQAVDPRKVRGVSATMVKTRTTELELVALVRRLLRRGRAPAVNREDLG